VRWVNAKPNHTISWTVQPHKKSINFGIFKHPGHAGGNPNAQTSNIALFPPPSPNLAVADDDSKSEQHAASTVIDKLKAIGLKQVAWIGRCEPDKPTQGKYEVPPGEAGNYALVFDNTFSKSLSKTATFFLLTFPSANASQIQFGAQMHHSQAMAGAMAIAHSAAPSRSPKLRPLGFGKGSSDSLRKQSAPSIHEPLPEHNLTTVESASIHTGVLQKRRRKRGQGFAKRFFCLDYSTSTLSYYHDRNSSALRGAIPLSLAAIGANAKTREISIDSGAEIWHLKASNQADFDSWKKALEKASELMTEATPGGENAGVDTSFQTPRGGAVPDDQDWARLEILLSRMSGIRDAVRRLGMEAPPVSPATAVSPRSGSGPPSGPPTPTDGQGEDYFGKADEKRPFWKRKASTPTVQSALFKRSVSAQLAVPMPGGVEPVIRNGMGSHGREVSIHDHCKAMLHDLDSVVSEFSQMLNESKIRRLAAPMSAVSRLSMQSVDSQEYFDADDGSKIFDIHHDSEQEASTDTEAVIGDGDSATSSDIDDASFVGGTRGARSGSLSSFIPPKSKTLQPLPLDPVRRRDNVLPPTIMPPSLIGFLRKNVGKDLSTIAMPVSANEPTSLLQRAAEQLEYSELLDHAARMSDPMERMMYVAAFAISSLSGSRVKERSIRKPFNPMLGETYELIREDKGFRFIAEKVSHRPVQLAFHAEASEWSFTQSPKPLQKFWGKSSEINTEGKARLVLYTHNESYSWTAATCFLRNIIAGEKYVEPVGTMTILNETNGMKGVATFKSGGMFSGRSEEVDVRILDDHGQVLPLGLDGTWTQSLKRKEGGLTNKEVVWEAGPLVDKAPKHYGMTKFAATLNEITSIEKDTMASTDSRFRVDQRALENGNHDEAEHLKNELEEAQRSRRRDMEASGEQWRPRWFSKVESGDEVIWKLKTGKEGYWDERAKGQWTGVVPVLKI
jgi:oxysterol-binding protein-related protein 3/6/7